MITRICDVSKLIVTTLVRIICECCYGFKETLFSIYLPRECIGTFDMYMYKHVTLRRTLKSGFGYSCYTCQRA